MPFGYYVFNNLVLHGSAVSKDTAFGLLENQEQANQRLRWCLENGFNFITEDILVVDDGNVRTSLPFVKSSEYFIKNMIHFYLEKIYI